MNTRLLIAIIIIIFIVFACTYRKNNEYYNDYYNEYYDDCVPKYLYFNKYTGSQYHNKKRGCQPYGDRTIDVFSAFFMS